MSEHDYGSSSYWDKRYREEKKPFDWYQPYKNLKGIVDDLLKGREDPHILYVGCGNSLVANEMYEEGYKQIDCIDISQVIVEKMSEEYASYPGLTFRVMDVTDMAEYKKETFDLVLDKGTLDAILCGNESYKKANKMMLEIQRVLKPEGFFMEVTYGDKDSRMTHLKGKGLSWKSKDFLELKKPLKENESHFVYVMAKSPVEKKEP